MENNLKLEEASPYLPFNLNFVLTHDKTDDFYNEDWFEEEKFKKGAIWQLCGYAPSDLNIYIGEGTIDGFLYRNDMTYVNFNTGLKPLLKPLSDYLDINSKVMNDLNWDLSLQIQLSEMARQGGWWNYSALLIKECAKEHIDFQNLIGQEKAININTINLK